MELGDFQSRSHLPIARLDPSLDTSKSFVKGIVTLLWPYSSSNQYTSILVVEPDFRLRRKQGQVRISFKGRTARAVAKSGLTSGDEVIVALTHAKWLRAENNAGTPGRGVGWELQFGEHVILQFTRNAEELVPLDLSKLSPSPPPETVTGSAVPSEISLEFALASTTTLLQTQSQTWPSPAFLKRKGFPATAIFSTQYDPFTETGNSDDDRRKKTKLGRASGQWRFSERSPSPIMQTENQFGEEVDTPEQMHYSADRDQPMSAQLTPKTPCENGLTNQTSSKSGAAQLGVVTKFVTSQSVVGDENNENAYLPEQPRLRPQTSPELLVVSPFRDRKTRFVFLQDQVDWQEQTAEQGYNGAFRTESTGLDGTGQIHELQEYVQGPGVEYLKSRTILKTPTGFHDASAGLENLTHEHSQPYRGAPVQYRDGLAYQENYGNTVSVDRKPSPKLMNYTAEEVQQRGQENTKSLDLDLPKNVQLDDLWDGSRSRRNEVFNMDIPNTDNDLQRHELHTMAATSDNEDDKVSEVEEEPNVTRHGQDVSHSELMAEPQRSFIVDQSDYDASDLDDERQDLQTNSESAIHSMGKREDTSSVEQFPTTLHLGNTLPFNNTTREQDQYRMKVINIASDDSEESEESEDADGSGSEESNSPLTFDRPVNAADQVEKVQSLGETYEQQISVSPSVGPVAQSTNTLDQLDADDDIGQSIISDYQSDLKNRHIIPFTPEASGLSSKILEQGDSHDNRALRSTDAGIISEQEFSPNQEDRNLSYDSSIIETVSSLITPLATQLQQVDEYASRFKEEVEALDDNHNLLTPRDTQTISEDRIDTVGLNQSRPLIGLLRKLRNSSEARVENSNNLHETQGNDVSSDGDKHDESDSSDEHQTFQNEESDHESASQEVLPNSKSLEVKSPKPISAELDYRHKTGNLLPIPLSTGFRTPLSYFVPLSSLPEYFNSTIDVMVIAVSASQFGRATKGPRDYYETVHITDPSSAISDTLPHITTVQIFRPFKIALPIVSIGDAVLLRNFKVQTQKQMPILLSTDSSAWAVFRKGLDVQIRGPQLEFGPEERCFARGLGDWWVSLDDQGRAELLNSVPKPEAGGKSKGKEKEKATRNSTVVHELRDGTRYMDGRVDGMDGVHELRDGTVYTDDAV